MRVCVHVCAQRGEDGRTDGWMESERMLKTRERDKRGEDGEEMEPKVEDVDRGGEPESGPESK